MAEIVKFPVGPIGGWAIIEREIKTETGKLGFPDAVTLRLVSRMKSFYEFYEQIDVRLNFSVISEFPPNISYQDAVAIRSKIPRDVSTAVAQFQDLCITSGLII
jgi:hypothetical protein